MVAENGFSGFAPKTWQFLKKLAIHNEKTWFIENRPQYEKDVLQPMMQLVSDMSPSMFKLDPNFETRPMIDKTISRIYRDIRFSKDKRPFRSSVWLTFKQKRKDWKEAPAYFFEISPTGYRYGMGFYCATKATMDALRQAIVEKTRSFTIADKCLHKNPHFELHGEEYKRVLNTEVPEKWLSWYQKKSLFIMAQHDSHKEIEKSAWSKKLSDQFLALHPIYQFLWSIKR